MHPPYLPGLTLVNRSARVAKGTASAGAVPYRVSVVRSDVTPQDTPLAKLGRCEGDDVSGHVIVGGLVEAVVVIQDCRPAVVAVPGVDGDASSLRKRHSPVGSGVEVLLTRARLVAIRLDEPAARAADRQAGVADVHGDLGHLPRAITAAAPTSTTLTSRAVALVHCLKRPADLPECPGDDD